MSSSSASSICSDAEVGVGAEADVFVGVVVGAFGCAYYQAALAEVVEKGGLDSHPDRVVQGKLEDAEAQLDTAGLDGDGAGEYQRVAVDAFAGEVVFGNPDGIEPQRFDQHGLVQAFLYGLLVVGVVEFHGVEEVAEAHCASVFCCFCPSGESNKSEA